ncbi:MAG: SDR family NAD(P)-dependent oxidoreductase [Bacillota bacterium]
MSRGCVLITGASTGIGEASALHLDRLGFQVFAGVRKAADGEALRAKGSQRLTPVILDVTDPGQIAAARALVERSIGEAPLVGLVNNAGIALAGPLEFLPLDDLRLQLEVNLVGQLAVTQAFLPLIRKARGRIVNVGSISGRMANPLLGPYAMSKFALEAMTASLRQEVRKWGIHVCLIGPGAVATPIWRKSMAAAEERLERMDPQVTALYGDLIEAMRRYQARRGDGGIPPLEVARAIEHALTAAKPRTRYAVGPDARLVELLRLLPDETRERMVARRLANRG